MAVIALDVGGSSIKHGIVRQLTPHNVIVQTTPIDSRGTLTDIVGTFTTIIMQHLVTNPDIHKVAFGFPGPFNYNRGVSYITGLAKYEALYEQNIAQHIRQKINRPDLTMRFRNDAEAAIVGEAVYGAGKDFKRVLGITLGTGIGSTFLTDGKPTSGEGLPMNGWLYAELFNGQQADDVFSTRGLLARFQARNVNLQKLVDADLSQSKTQEILRLFGLDLGTFLKPYTTTFDADAVIILGGIASLFEYFGTSLQSQLAPKSVIQGKLEERAALLGAASLFN